MLTTTIDIDGLYHCKETSDTQMVRIHRMEEIEPLSERYHIYDSAYSMIAMRREAEMDHGLDMDRFLDITAVRIDVVEMDHSTSEHYRAYSFFRNFFRNSVCIKKVGIYIVPIIPQRFVEILLLDPLRQAPLTKIRRPYPQCIAMVYVAKKE